MHLRLALAAAFAGILAMAYPARAFAAPMPLQDSAAVISLQANAQALDDPTGRWSIEDVSRLPPRAFKPAAMLLTDYRVVTRWYRFSVNDRSAAGTQWFVSASPYGRSAELYFPQRAAYGLVRFGWDLPFAERPAHAQLPAAPILPSMYGKVLYLRVVQVIPLFPPAIRSAENLDVYDRAVGGALLGFLSAIVLLSMLLAWRLRSVMYLWNGLTFLCGVGAGSVTLLLAPQYFWPTISLPLRVLANAFYVGIFIGMTLYAREFLPKEYRRTWLGIPVWASIVLIALSGIYRVFDQAPGGATVLTVFIILWYAAVTAAAVNALRGGLRAVRFFIPGLSAYVGCIFINNLALLGFGSFSFSTMLPYLGLAMNAVIFQLALADRLLLAGKEREDVLAALSAERQNVIDTQTRSVALLETYNKSFARFVPKDFLQQLGRPDIVDVRVGDHVERDMAVLFADIRSFTALSERLTPSENFDFVNGFFARCEPVIRHHHGFIDKFVGDAVMALFEDAGGALDAAIALQHEIRHFNQERARRYLEPVQVGTGIHFGRVMLGTVGGDDRMDTTVISGVVNAASRIEGLTKEYASPIIASQAVIAALPSGAKYGLRPLGPAPIRGAEHAVEIYEACDADPPDVLLHKMRTLEDFAEAVRNFVARDFSSSAQLFGAIASAEPRDVVAAAYAIRASSGMSSDSA